MNDSGGALVKEGSGADSTVSSVNSMSSVSTMGEKTLAVECSITGAADAVSVAVVHWPCVIGHLRNSDRTVAVSEAIGVAGLVLDESSTRTGDGSALSVALTIPKTIAIHSSGPDGGEGAASLVSETAVSVR